MRLRKLLNKRAQKVLVAHFGPEILDYPERIRKLSDETLLALPGCSKVTVRHVREILSQVPPSFVEQVTPESIVAVFAEPAEGPGWRNHPVWVILRNPDGRLVERCLQPEEQTEMMRFIYEMSARVHAMMKAQAYQALTRHPRSSERNVLPVGT